MIMFRIGGDEFALLTASKDIAVAKDLANKVLEMNGVTFTFKDKKIPLSLWVGTTKVPKASLRYGQFFTNMHEAINECKDENSGAEFAH